MNTEEKQELAQAVADIVMNRIEVERIEIAKAMINEYMNEKIKASTVSDACSWTDRPTTPSVIGTLTNELK